MKMHPFYLAVALVFANTAHAVAPAPRLAPNPLVQKWAKLFVETRVLKGAIGECLNDNSGDAVRCDSTELAELGKYSITAMPVLSNASVEVMSSTAAIQIMGDATLGNCTFQIHPKINQAQGTINWYPYAITQAVGNVNECVKYVKNATIW